MEMLRNKVSGKNKGRYLRWQRGYILTHIKNSADFQIKNSRKMGDIRKIVFEFNWLRKDKEMRLSQFYLNSHCLQNTIQIFSTIFLILVQFWWVVPSLLSNSSFTQSCWQSFTHYRGHDNKLSTLADASLAPGHLENTPAGWGQTPALLIELRDSWSRQKAPPWSVKGMSLTEGRCL